MVDLAFGGREPAHGQQGRLTERLSATDDGITGAAL